MAPAPACNPTYAASNVTGTEPKTFERRRRALLPALLPVSWSAFTISRKVWSSAVPPGNTYWRSGCATALPVGYGPWGDAVQEITRTGSLPESPQASINVIGRAILGFIRFPYLV